jgi:hypothetical protein
MNFGDALAAVKQGARITRHGWNGQGMWVLLEETSRWPHSRMRPFLYMKAVNDELVPWVASQTDLLAEDWEVL